MKNTPVLAALSMLAGFMLARYIVALSKTAPPPPPGPAIVQATPVTELRFPLSPADVPLDREYPTVVADPKTSTIVAAWAAATRPDSGNTSRTLWLTRSTDGGKTFDSPKAWREVPVYAFTSGGGSKPGDDKSKPARTPMQFSTHLLPRLVMAGDRMVLGWVEAVNGGPKAAFCVAESTDGGLTFSQPRAIGGEQATRPGFISLASDDQGRILAAWLDNPAKAENTTEKKSDDSNKSGSSKSGGPKVFTCREKADKSGFEPARLVYEGPENKGVCPCCDVSVAAAANDTLLYAFRNNVADIRDIWLGQVSDDKPAPPVALTDRKWNFAGCPHDGPSMAKSGDKIITGWMDAKDGRPRIFLSTFQAGQHATVETVPVTAGPEGSQSHVRVIPDQQGGIYIVWDQSELKQPGGTHGDHQAKPENNTNATTARGIVLAHRPAGSSHVQGRIELKSPADRLPRNPAICTSGDAIILAWSELGGTEGKSVRIQRVNKIYLKPVESSPENSENN